MLPSGNAVYNGDGIDVALTTARTATCCAGFTCVLGLLCDSTIQRPRNKHDTTLEECVLIPTNRRGEIWGQVLELRRFASG